MCVLNTFYDNTLMFYIRKENLALNKPTWQKHPWQDSTIDFGSENAVDGLYSDRGIRGQCTFNDDGYYTAEWRVDLGRVVSISYINIYYRTENRSMIYTYFVNKMSKLYERIMFLLLCVIIIKVKQLFQ